MASTSSTRVPVGEIRVCVACCCAIQGCSCKYPECCGCERDAVCCCFKCVDKSCKKVESDQNEDKKCCICFEGGCYCVKPSTCCGGVQQCCCLDQRCAFPCNEQVPCICTFLPCCSCCAGSKCKVGCCKKIEELVEDLAAGEVAVGAKEEKAKDKELSDVPVAELIVCMAFCCTLHSCLCKYPECYGAKAEGTCLCFSQEQACCKIIKEENQDNICCICQEGGCYCIQPQTCCLGQQQCFCIDNRCAFPCHPDKVPCICTLLPCCTICADKQCKVKCCGKVGDIVERLAKVAPNQQQMLS